jgi:NAD(P)-dependent dehydrogenase (short-subunit alcohol dehydrogenase family)
VLANEVSAFGVKVIIVEPGAFRTDWMGSSMTMHEPGADYRDAVAFIHELRRTANGSQQGDPARAARIIIDVVEAPEPPRRLLLGSDAVELALASGAERDAEARQWANVSCSADFPE